MEMKVLCMKFSKLYRIIKLGRKKPKSKVGSDTEAAQKVHRKYED